MGFFFNQVRRQYPLTVSDLTKPEMKQLTDILMLENPPMFQVSRPPQSEFVNMCIKEGIKALPSALRHNRILQLISSVNGREARLCESHNGLNQYIIGHLYSLLKAEVKDRLRTMDKHQNQMHEPERKMLHSVQSLRRLWGKAPPDGVKELGITYPFPQGNRCHACILARIATDPGYLRNLRMALVSRMKTGGEQRAPPRLLAFVDRAIKFHPESMDITHESDRLAADFKPARKVAAVIASEYRQSYNEEVERYLNHGSKAKVDVHLHPALREEYLAQQQSSGNSKGKGKAMADDSIFYDEQTSPDEKPSRAGKGKEPARIFKGKSKATDAPETSGTRSRLTSELPDNNANVLKGSLNGSSKSDSEFSESSVNNPVEDPQPS